MDEVVEKDDVVEDVPVDDVVVIVVAVVVVVEGMTDDDVVSPHPAMQASTSSLFSSPGPLTQQVQVSVNLQLERRKHCLSNQVKNRHFDMERQISWHCWAVSVWRNPPSNMVSSDIGHDASLKPSQLFRVMYALTLLDRRSIERSMLEEIGRAHV